MVEFKKFSKQDADVIMQEWISSNGEILPKVEKDFDKIRKDLEKLYPDEAGARKDYTTDVEMGIKLYEYLDSHKEWFNMRLASDDSFWRTMTVRIAPHLVAKRWGFDNIDHYYIKPRRNWFKAIWWYIYLSDPKKLYKTREVLLSKNFTTDTIEALVERPGSEGFNVKLCRKIVEYYSRVSYNGSMSELFRSVMKLNTARTMVMEPALCEGGTEGYVKALFTDLNATIVS